MAVKPIVIETFLELAASHPVLDVRSPSEFNHAHIPGAYSLPLFADEERKVVGTAYKQQSREQAIKIGLDYFGPKMRPMVEEVEKLLQAHHVQQTKSNPIINSNDVPQTILVHCWRGGMRSGGVAWLLDLYGFRVYTLIGGYKSYRHHILEQFEAPVDLKIIGGYTGTGKTEILQKLERLGEPIIDLEALAMHKGSAFGHLGQPEQPSQEMFENMLGMKLRQWHLTKETSGKAIWAEDESLRIGNLLIPQPFYKQMRSSPCYFLDVPFEERLDFIVKDYGKADRDKLIGAILRIQKRLGGLETKTAINSLIENDIRSSFAILLKYYDKWYLKGLDSREPGTPVIALKGSAVDHVRNAQLLLKQLKQN